MRAVWSFWTMPYRARRGFSWERDHTHLLSWILSVGLAREHFDSIALHTDNAGAALLVDRLGLDFDHVSTSLNQLNGHDPDWWMQGKLHTYAEQQEPFVHLDCDVYLFKPLPERLMTAAVLAQNPEEVSPRAPWYDVEACELAIRAHGDGHIPPEWTWYRTFVPDQKAACCGIFGGHCLDFIRAYATTARFRLDEKQAGVQPILRAIHAGSLRQLSQNRNRIPLRLLGTCPGSGRRLWLHASDGRRQAKPQSSCPARTARSARVAPGCRAVPVSPFEQT